MKKVSGGFVFNTEESTLLATNSSEYGVTKIYRTTNDRYFSTFEPTNTDGETESASLDYIPDGINGVDSLLEELSDDGNLVINFEEFQIG